MSFMLEWKKIRRTGLMPAFFGGGVLAAAVPVLNMSFRSEIYAAQSAAPVTILLRANWQMMSMLNVLLVVLGACILYHIEYADNALQKMCTLPAREIRMFLGKAAVLAAAVLLMLAMEAASVFGCAVYWFGPAADLYGEILGNFGFFLLLMLPTVLLSLVTASLCRNMWISLGIGVICVSAATMIPGQNFVLTLFPFAMPFRTLSDYAGPVIRNYMAAGVLETAGIALLEVLILNVRRWFE